MKKLYVKICLLFGLIFLCGFTTYTKTGSVNLAWDSVTTDLDGNSVTIDHYEIKLIRDVTLEQFNYGTSNTTISVPKPKSGKWEILVRAVKKANDGTMIPSDWCSSMNVQIDKDGRIISCTPCTCAKLQDGTYGSWKVYWKPGGVLGPIIIR